MNTNTQLAVVSKKIHRKKKTIEFLNRIKSYQASISFFIDPLLFHRIYRDLLVPNRISNEPIYHFKAYLGSKSITQIHVREGGVVLQFSDNLPDYITPIGLLQDRLNSVGNAFCHDLAEFLPKYYESFERKSEFYQKSNKKIKFPECGPFIYEKSTSGLLLEEIDKILSKTTDEILLITVHQQNRFDNDDDKMQMLVFNKNLIKVLTAVEDFKNMFEDDFVEQLLQVFKTYSFDQYMEELVSFLKSFPLKEIKESFSQSSDIYKMDLNTRFGLLKVNFGLKNEAVEINGCKFRLICSIIEKETRNFLMNLIPTEKKNADENEKKVKKFKDWSKMFKIYYINENT